MRQCFSTSSYYCGVSTVLRGSRQLTAFRVTSCFDLLYHYFLFYQWVYILGLRAAYCHSGCFQVSADHSFWNLSFQSVIIMIPLSFLYGVILDLGRSIGLRAH